jgi:benzoate-CoA ligase
MNTLPEHFNFASFLIERNAARGERVAYRDDTRSLSYGALHDGIRRCAGLLRSAGLQREQRVLLLMHDNVDWPVAFLGALYAGVVPVAVNTLLTADDYAYMLQHSRAQAVLTSGALLPVLREALGKVGSDSEVRQIWVSTPPPELRADEAPFLAALDAAVPLAAPAATLADEAAFWL